MESSLRSRAFRLLSGAIVAHLVTLAASPFLARVYSPSDFGLFQLVVSLSVITATFATLRLDLVVIVAESKDESLTVVGLALAAITSVALCVISVAFLIRFAWPVEAQGPLIRALPFVAGLTWLAGANQVLVSWASREEAFTRMAQARAAQALTTVAAQVVLAIVLPGRSAGLVVGHIVGTGLSTALLLSVILPHLRGRVRDVWSWSRLRTIAGRFQRFSAVSSWATLVDSASGQLPALLLGLQFTRGVVGQYAIAVRMLSAPLGLVSQAIAQVFYQAASARRSDVNHVATLVTIMFDRLLVFGSVPLLLLGIAAPDLFPIIFGARWHEAGVYTQLLAPWLAVQLVFSPLTYLFFIRDQPKLFLRFTVWQFVGLAAGALVGGLASPRLAVGLLSVSGCVVCIIFLRVALHSVGLRVGHLLRRNVQALIWGAALLGSLLVFDISAATNAVSRIVAAMVTVLIYLAAMVVRAGPWMPMVSNGNRKGRD